jgi:hypothetical protein
MRETEDRKVGRGGWLLPDLLILLFSLLISLFSLVSCAGAAGGEGGETIATRDVRVTNAGGAAQGQSTQGYDYVARRALSVVGLAEARGIDAQVARAAVERLADALDTCVTDQGHQGRPVDGAARVVAQIEADGSVSGASLRVDPGEGVAATAALCLVAPLKQLSFGASDAGPRGLAIEALWGRISSR